MMNTCSNNAEEEIPVATMPSYRVRDVVPFEGRFPSWEAFEVARKSHCEKTHTLYVCRNTVKVSVANKRRKFQVPESWVYDRKVFICTHGYKRVSRSSGLRPRQKTRFSQCNARFTASVVCDYVGSKEVLCIKVSGHHFEHNDHPVTQEQWRNYSQNRASIIDHPYLVQEAELLRRIGSNKRTTKEHLQTLSGRVCTMKDIHNLYARLKKKEEQVKSLTSPEIRVESILQQFVDKHVENHVSILSGDDGSNEAICLASKCMKELFQVFPQVIMVDCTVSSTTPDFNMHGFLSFDVVGNGKPIYLSHSLNTSASLFRRVCQDFKRTHPKWIDIKLMVLDKNIPEISILEQEFPDAKILLCQLSCIKFLGSLDIQNEYQILTPDLQDKVHNIVKQIILASSEVAYNASKNQLLLALGNRMDHPFWIMFDQIWEPCRHVWVKYKREPWHGTENPFGSRLEAFWIPLRNTFERADSIIKSVQEVLAMVHFVDEEWSSKILLLEMTKPMSDFVDSSLLFVANSLSHFSAQLIAFQAALMSSHVSSYSHTSSKHEQKIRIYRGKKRNQIVATMDLKLTQCDCGFYQAYLLPCEHLIWYEQVILQEKYLSLKAVHTRWFLRTYKLPPITSEKESNEIEYHIL